MFAGIQCKSESKRLENATDGIAVVTLCTKDNPNGYDIKFRHGLPHIIHQKNIKVE